MPSVINLSKDHLVVVHDASASGYEHITIGPGESRVVDGRNLSDLGTVIPGLRDLIRDGVVYVEWSTDGPLAATES